MAFEEPATIAGCSLYSECDEVGICLLRSGRKQKQTYTKTTTKTIPTTKTPGRENTRREREMEKERERFPAAHTMCLSCCVEWLCAVCVPHICVLQCCTHPRTQLVHRSATCRLFSVAPVPELLVHRISSEVWHMRCLSLRLRVRRVTTTSPHRRSRGRTSSGLLQVRLMRVRVVRSLRHRWQRHSRGHQMAASSGQSRQSGAIAPLWDP